MNIGVASEKSGLPSKTIRYYEDIGLVRPARTDNGYRDYSVADIHRLRFLQRSRESADVKAIAETKLVEIDRKIAELAGLRHLLHHLVEHCHGDERPDCPIIDELAGEGMVQ
jgi:MerR family copper efflux transcriptional regulator